MTRLAMLGLLAALVLMGCERDAATDTGLAEPGEAAGGFVQARPGTTLRFPEDHGPHPDTRIEWWYLTANLEDERGEPLGLQWTLFRQALVSPAERPRPGPWVADQAWMAHMAVSRGPTHRVAERFARGHSRQDDGQAGVRARPFAAWLDDWRLESRVDDPDADTFAELALLAHQDDEHGGFGYRLDLTAEGPLVLHGEAGFSQKTADGQGSIYYSQPFWRIEGEVTLDGETRAVSGRGWLDREWSSQVLEPEQSGWDWVALHLDSGHKLMAYRLRGGGEEGGDFLFGNVIAPDGAATPVAQGGLRLTPLSTSLVAGREMPTRWRLELPAQGLDLVVEARHSERWMATSVSYWEGEVTVSDHDGGEALGVGYLEMTGY
ncbi:lipocalin-like domain-containing protein [Halomonas sp. LBP4]|uniref:lipocalin-like domain-containing protein n=1 Tax=Halomonas sp. LBP4 TaxID=2044917 RepID=UPI000D773939|nr:lipocalin-like domain-containing protein [Halomonas sp. LBP4]PXX96321.1 iron ABC transporter permease [Halomonas sp. LBP4]